ncbi:hypothetical protein MtrunA17_Chr2g0306991 [Medicago truncatula]|uniref:Uncharacterized protein n=1 Tax=Medicago truncatula TaxID=3880 RepID=A0A396JG97_MEDTR|nr:hypothetical protein MtrunA17_Chr2g0306991 [Medicago truncatula]
MKSSTKLLNLFCDLSSLVYDHRTGVCDHCTGKVIHNYFIYFSSLLLGLISSTNLESRLFVSACVLI